MATENTSSIISSIYKSRNIILEMMDSQNYNTLDYSGFNINDINSMFNNKQLDMVLEKNSTDENETERKSKTYILYYLAKTLRPQNIQEIVEDLFTIEEILTKEDNLYIIVKDEANETIINYLKHIWEQDKIFIVIINLKRLQFNILEHTLVPKHRIMSQTEVVKMKERYNIMENKQLPEISRFDPVAQVIGIRPGQICEITRPSKTAVSSKYYRICT
jgi:DNA-directed RNA polymerase subunit H (RpoH/RPB5)